MSLTKALIIVGLQNDFCQGGALAVPGANEVIPYINALMRDNHYDTIVATQDWHPTNYQFFASTHGEEVGTNMVLGDRMAYLWQDHCVEGTWGADFHPDLDQSKIDFILKKGMNPDLESYSAFRENKVDAHTFLMQHLGQKKVELVEVVGLALEYQVQNTCLDARNIGLLTCLHYRGTRAVNVKPENSRDAIFRLIQNNVTVFG